MFLFLLFFFFCCCDVFVLFLTGHFFVFFGFFTFLFFIFLLLFQDSDLENDGDGNNGDGNGNGLDDGLQPPRKRRRLNKKAQGKNKNKNKQVRSSKRQQERATRNYYRFTYYSLHSSGIAYNLARNIHKADNDMLWLAILGLTELFIFEKIDRQQYDAQIVKYRDEVIINNPPYDAKNGQNSNSNAKHRNKNGNKNNKNNNNNDDFIVDDGMSDINDNGNDNNGNNNINNNNRNNLNVGGINMMDDGASYEFSDLNIESNKVVLHRKRGHIQFSQEFRFTMMRFWTLYDSMYYSRYIGSKLGVWTEVGKNRLKELMAKMALPLAEAQQPFANMKRQFKAQLPCLLNQHAKYYKLDEDICYGSFTKQHGSNYSISAADMVTAITAVLEADYLVYPNSLINNNDNNNKQMNNKNNNNNNSNNDHGNSSNEYENKEELIDDDYWKENFWACYDATSIAIKNQANLEIAISLAKSRQKSIVRTGIDILERKQIKTLDILKIVRLDDKNDFQTVMSLRSLALFIIDSFAEYRASRGKVSNKGSSRAFVLASYLDKTQSYLVMGIPAKAHRGDVQKSIFGRAFADTAKKIHARFAAELFDGSCIEIKKEDFNDWLEMLHEAMYESIIS